MYAAQNLLPNPVPVKNSRTGEQPEQRRPQASNAIVHSNANIQNTGQATQ